MSPAITGCRTGNFLHLLREKCIFVEAMLSFKKIVYLVGIALVLCMSGFFYILYFVNPLHSGPAIILSVFLLIYLIALCLLFLALYIVLRFVIYIRGSKKDAPDSDISPRALKIIYYLASIFAFAPVYIIGMQSLGQLEFRDLLLLIVLQALLLFYVLKANRA